MPTVPKQHQAIAALSYYLCLKESNKTTSSKHAEKLSHKMKYHLWCKNKHRDYSVLKFIIIIIIIIIIINFLLYFINYRVGINYFPDNKHLLQENYVEYKYEQMLKCTNVL